MIATLAKRKIPKKTLVLKKIKQKEKNPPESRQW
jgi:hypothetical protein